jgi:hypothetical protein
MLINLMAAASRLRARRPRCRRSTAKNPCDRADGWVIIGSLVKLSFFRFKYFRRRSDLVTEFLKAIHAWPAGEGARIIVQAAGRGLP